jgi:hypothetical protein
MPASTRRKKATTSKEEPEFPVRCKTWEEVRRIQEKYCKVIGYSPKGTPCYRLEEVRKYVIFPKDELTA